MVKKTVTKEKALEKLEFLCNRSEQCEFDLNRKLVNWGILSAERKELLQSLKDNRLLDDERFAKAYANDKARFSAWGPHKIRIELLKRRINTGVINNALRNVESEVWKQGILRCAQSKSKNLDLTGDKNWENGQKLYKYLIGRGFPSEASSKMVNLIKKKQENTDD